MKLTESILNLVESKPLPKGEFTLVGIYNDREGKDTTWLKNNQENKKMIGDKSRFTKEGNNQYLFNGDHDSISLQPKEVISKNGLLIIKNTGNLYFHFKEVK